MDWIELSINGVLQNLTWDQLSEKLGTGLLREDIASLNSTVSNNIRSMNISWLISSATLVFIMQAGFSMQEVGSVRVKNTKSILVKNIMDVCIGSLLFYMCGFAFAFGEGNAFIGWTGFAMQEGFKNGTYIIRGNTHYTGQSEGYNGYEYAFWVFQFAFSATTSTIVSGAVAERTKLSAYGVYTFVLSFIVYPVVVHWGWSDDGWASPYGESRLFGVGIIDFAGSCMVHMVGGASALVGAFVVGPRKGRFGQYRVFIQQQNTTFQVVGTLLLWFGWYGFNTGATLGINGVSANVAAKVAANTTLSAASAGFVVMILVWFLEGKIEPAPVCNGILAGLVSITAGCSVIEPELTLVTGCLGGVIYYWSSKLLIYCKIDDVVDASPVHLGCGLWGTLAAGLFAHPGNTAMAHNLAKVPSCGLVYGGNGGYQFAANLVFCLVVLGWTSGIMGATFTVLKIARLFRVTGNDEDFGLDKITHGGMAYENPAHSKDSSSYKDDSQRTTHFTSNGLDMISSTGDIAERRVL